jgi:hypothetical protein
LHLIKNEPTYVFVPPGPDAVGVPFKIKKSTLTKTAAGGTFLFDKELGLLHSAQIEVKMAGQLTVDIGGQQTEVEVIQSQKTIIRSTAK